MSGAEVLLLIGAVLIFWIIIHACKDVGTYNSSTYKTQQEWLDRKNINYNRIKKVEHLPNGKQKIYYTDSRGKLHTKTVDPVIEYRKTEEEKMRRQKAKEKEQIRIAKENLKLEKEQENKEKLEQLFEEF